ncbi:interferon-induced, double-stranded RNA-activated protein kinase-like isoform X2 [Sardina pilchardus]|uniref:interferon-induced, double-stranded RNA-activated protein kinase-like isoform X2 n=1 Tax=Sardina pilchardus TaxID=27697 RepID=UPI002E0FF488
MNYVAKLNEYGQQTRVQVQYEEVDVSGPDHIKTFTVRAIVNGKPYPEGVGKNKREAKENAAQRALENLLLMESSDFNTSTTSQTSEIPASITQANYQCWLNEHSHKTRVIYKAIESTRVDLVSTPQCCKYVSNGKSYPEAYASSKKEAREKAAKLVYEEILKEEGVIEGNNGHNSRQQEASNNSVSDLSNNLEHMRVTPTKDLSSDIHQANFIGMLNHHCQQRKLTRDFKLVERRGPSHNPEFVYKVVIGGDEYPEGCGRTAKEAKQLAAQLAWNKIQDQPQCHSQVSSMSSLKSSLSEDDSLYLTPTIDESPQDERASTSMAASASDWIIFKDSSKDSPKIQVAAPAQNKTKRILAPNFNNAPQRSKEAGPNLSSNLTGQVTVQPRLLEEYDSIKRIGKGGFGRVFKARNKFDETYYAVKIVKSTEKAKREVKALARLQHPNIVRYHTCWINNTAYGSDGSDSYSTSNSGSNSTMEFLYIKMELCEGNTLSMWIKENNVHPDPKRRQDALDITKQIAKAVVYIHSQNLIHRDLKPANIMFGRNREVKIGDFGLVTIADDDNDESLLERTKHTGTRSYMSPEQMNQPTYDRKVDIFALGLIYFELLWTVKTKAEKCDIWEHIKTKKFPEGFRDQFCFEHALIERMLYQDPVDRPEAHDLVPVLENCKSFQDQNSNHGSTKTV